MHDLHICCNSRSSNFYHQHHVQPFCHSPARDFHEILVAAVLARGIRRATRLRYVSRTWNSAVMDAIFESGILEDVDTNMKLYWGRYLAFRAMGRWSDLSKPLRMIRKVGERIVAHRSSEVNHSFTDTELRECVFEICTLSDARFPYSLCHWDLKRADADEDEEFSNQIKIDKSQFKQALLAAAAGTNEVDLVRKLLPSFGGREDLICHDPGERVDFTPIFGYPITLAAFQGHDEVVELLVQAAGRRHHLRKHLVSEIMQSAAMGNRLSTLELVLESEYPSWNPYLVYGLEATTSVEIFKRLLPLAGNNLQPDYHENDKNYFRVTFLPRQLSWAAAAGNVAMMEHLVKLGATPWSLGAARRSRDGGDSWDPVYHAASNGRKEALVFLLVEGFPMTMDSLRAAVRYGDPRTVMVALVHFGEACPVPRLLSVAVEQENEEVCQVLLAFQELRLNGNLDKNQKGDVTPGTKPHNMIKRHDQEQSEAGSGATL